MDSVQANLADETKNCEVIKNIVLEELRRNKDINEETYEEYNAKWGVILIKTTWYSRLFKDSKDWQYRFVKINH